MKIKKSKGKSYISIRGRGVIRVKAKSKEEAIEKAKDEFEEMIDEATDDTFANVGLTKRWKGLLGLEEPKRAKKGKSELEELKWKNKPSGKWIEGVKKK